MSLLLLFQPAATGIAPPVPVPVEEPYISRYGEGGGMGGWNPWKAEKQRMDKQRHDDETIEIVRTIALHVRRRRGNA